MFYLFKNRMYWIASSFNLIFNNDCVSQLVHETGKFQESVLVKQDKPVLATLFLFTQVWTLCNSFPLACLLFKRLLIGSFIQPGLYHMPCPVLGTRARPPSWADSHALGLHELCWPVTTLTGRQTLQLGLSKEAAGWCLEIMLRGAGVWRSGCGRGEPPWGSDQEKLLPRGGQKPRPKR